MKGTWKTDSHGSGVLLLVVVVAVIAAAAAGPIVTAVGELLRVVLIGAVVLGVAAIAAVTGLVVWHKRRTPPAWAVNAPPPQRALQARTAAHSALPPQIHLHLHGPVSAADVAGLIARQGNPQPAAIEEDK